MRFCQSFMTELCRHLGEHTDVPAGDIGVGRTRDRIPLRTVQTNHQPYESGVLTGKGLIYGGAQVRREATGDGAAFFADEMLRVAGSGLAGQRVVVSGSGNVAIYAIEKIHQ